MVTPALARESRSSTLADRGESPARHGESRGSSSARLGTGLAGLVDTRTWTSDGGNTFPGAEAPFGMVQWSPDTKPSYNEGGGYGRTDNRLWGYSLTHVSGPGCSTAGDVPMLPLTGPLPSGDPNKITTAFSHTDEVAQAGYYSARSNGAAQAITSSFTATTHSAMARFTYPATAQAGFLIKLAASQRPVHADGVTIIGNNEIQGYVTSGDFCGESNNGGQPQLYTVYFDIVFDRPFSASQVITNPGQSDPAAVALTFNTTHDRVIRAKVGISYVSADDAKLNWETENPGWNFDGIRQRTQRDWDGMLDRIQVAGGSHAQTQEFYSLLYKDFLEPSITSDVNGQFMGADLKVHSLAPGQKNQYGMFSGWDTYHSLAQLQAMLDPSAAGDMAQSQVNYYSEDKILQQWGYDNLNNYVMVGDPADALIADYYTFGARNFQTKQALADMLAQATTVNDVRPGQALEAQYGFLPENGTYGCCGAHGFTSALLEYDTADLALAQFALDRGDRSDAARLTRRANNWENLFDPTTDLLTSRLENGLFEPGVTATFAGNFLTDHEPYVEGDPYEYLWDVPNDYAALFSLLGGDSEVVPALTEYLSRPNGYGMYAELTNEFDLGEQFALDYAGDPAGTQKAVANTRNTIYRPGPYGLNNNDDLGAISSTFIWEMLGMYPENPGSATLVFASPGFPQETIHLGNGHWIHINAPGASPSTYYVQSLTINGERHAKPWAEYSRLANGVTLNWSLGTEPTSWGSSPAEAPPSYTAGLRPVVGYESEQHVTLAPGHDGTVALGAQNATEQAQRVQVHVALPAASGLSVSPANSTLQVAPDGRATLELTVRATAAAVSRFDWVTVTFTTPGSKPQDVQLAVQIS
jgi:predicted alpha-1,2-mannosidase